MHIDKMEHVHYCTLHWTTGRFRSSTHPEYVLLTHLMLPNKFLTNPKPLLFTNADFTLFGVQTYARKMLYFPSLFSGYFDELTQSCNLIHEEYTQCYYFHQLQISEIQCYAITQPGKSSIPFPILHCVVRFIMVLLIHSYSSITYKHNNDSQFPNTIPSKQQKLYPAPSVNNWRSDCLPHDLSKFYLLFFILLNYQSSKFHRQLA